jgi:hypothetical protein
MHERPSLLSNNSRTGSVNSDYSIKVVAPGSADDHLINALVKRIFSKVGYFFSNIHASYPLEVIRLLIDPSRIRSFDKQRIH